MLSTFNLMLLIIMVMAAIGTVISRSLLKSAISLALVSAILAVLMFELASPLSGVFELSICTGLITVIFLSTIGLTSPKDAGEQEELTKKRWKRYRYLPVIVTAVALLYFWFIKIPMDFTLPAKEAAGSDVRNVLWNLRQIDLVGQITIILTGAFGVIILFRELTKHE
ncbi:MAG: NADH-quinone oxidoreductase subunit J [Candidatus Saganbacteria bacterium]|nr:NADH-quinone oxidoreductase subunit J [Candidatus Saganbacteria bacterium]